MFHFYFLTDVLFLSYIRESDAWGKGGQQIISQQIIVQVNANNEFFTALKRRREQQVIRNPLYF